MEQFTKFKGSRNVSMFNRETNSWEDVPREQVASLFQSGSYGIDPDATIDLVSPNGESGTTQGQHLQDLLAKGFQIQDYEASREEFLEKEYGDATGTAAALGAARGLSFGLSDVALQKAGVNQEFLRETKNRNRTASTVGEVGGIALPLLLSGGTSAFAQAGAKGVQGAGMAARAAQATRAAGTLPRAVARIGLAAEKKAAEAITKRLASKMAVSGATKEASKTMARLIAEKAIPKGIGSAVEGAFYGTGQLISEEALGNVELNAETVMSTIGLGTFLGGAIGGTIGTTGVIANKLRPKGNAKVLGSLGNEVDDVAQASDDVARLSDDSAGPFTQEEKFTSQKLADVTPDELRYYRQNKERIANQPTLKEMPNLYEDGVERLQTMMKQSEDAASEAIANSNAQMTTKELSDLITAKIDDLKGQPSTESTQGAINRLQSYLKGNVQYDDTGAIVNEVWDGKKIRKFIQGLRKDIRNAYQKNEITLKDEVVKDLVDMDLNEMLREKVPGLREIMEPYSKMMQTFKGLQKLEGRGGTNWFDQRFIKTLERNYSGFNTGKIKGTAVNKKSWEDTVRNFEELTGIKFQEIYNDRKVFSRLFPDQVSGREVGTSFENMGRAARQSLRNPQGAITDSFFGAAMNVANKGVNLVKNQAIEGTVGIGSLVNKFAAVEKIIKQQSRTIKDYVKSFVKTGSKEQALRGAGTSILLDVSYSPIKDSGDMPKTKKEAYQKRKEELDELVANPTLLVDLMGQNMQNMQLYAPKMAAHATQQLTKAVNFLHSKLPKDEIDNTLLPNKQKYEPSDEEVASFERYVEAVEDPLSVLDKAQNGTLTEEYIEAIQTVYPQIYQQIQTQIVEDLAELEEDLEYNKKIQLGILFNSQTDVTMTQGFIQMLQQAQSAAQQSEQKPPAGSQSIDLASRMQTRTDYLQSRRV